MASTWPFKMLPTWPFQMLSTRAAKMASTASFWLGVAIVAVFCYSVIPTVSAAAAEVAAAEAAVAATAEVAAEMDGANESRPTDTFEKQNQQGKSCFQSYF